jgi:hypothetical protein
MQTCQRISRAKQAQNRERVAALSLEGCQIVAAGNSFEFRVPSSEFGVLSWARRHNSKLETRNSELYNRVSIALLLLPSTPVKIYA